MTGRPQVAVVAGAAGGIGAAVVAELVAQEVTVVAADVDVDGLAAVVSASDGRVVPLQASVTDGDGPDRLVDAALSSFGSLDILVNAAGMNMPATIFDVDEDSWDTVLWSHVGGHLGCARAVLPVMRRQRYGRLVNLTSGAGLLRTPAAHVPYAVAKRCVAALTWALASHVAGIGDVTVNAVAPLARTPLSTARQGAGTPSRRQLEMLPSPALVAPVIAYLASPAATGINGAVLFTNGFEVSLVDPPSTTELLVFADTDDSAVGAAIETVFRPAAILGASTGGASPRLGLHHDRG